MVIFLKLRILKRTLIYSYTYVNVNFKLNHFLRKSDDVPSINANDEKFYVNANASYHVDHANMMYNRC